MPSDSGTLWDSFLFTAAICSSSSFSSSSCATSASPSGLMSWSEHLPPNRLSHQLTAPGLERGHVQVLWCVDPAFYCQCGCLSTLQSGNKQEGPSSTSFLSCTYFWECPSLQTASWPPSKSLHLRYLFIPYLEPVKVTLQTYYGQCNTKESVPRHLLILFFTLKCFRASNKILYKRKRKSKSKKQLAVNYFLHKEQEDI